MSGAIDPEKEYGTETVARLLGMSARMVRVWLRKGKLAGEMRDGKWRVSGSELLRLRQTSSRALFPTPAPTSSA